MSIPELSETVGVSLDRIVLALSEALDLVGVDQVGHGRRVALMACAAADTLGWNADRRRDLARACLLHDCGVSSTREHHHLVNELDWDGSRAHCLRGEAFLASVPRLAYLAPAIGEHHSHWSDLCARKVDRDTALFANLIYLADRMDALHAEGVGEGKPIFDVLDRYPGYFAPDLLAAMRPLALREAFWFSQEEPSLRERMEELLEGGDKAPLEWSDIHALARMFGRIIDAKSAYTERHSIGVARAARLLGALSDLSPGRLDMIEIAGLLHDLGKLRVPDELLEKRGPLSHDERRRMARHAFDTWEVLRHAFGPGQIAQWAAYHHEAMSGDGYPFHCRDGDLPREARIIAVADVFQALAQTRPYRAALTPTEIVAHLDGMVFGGKLDGDVVKLVKSNVDAVYLAAISSEGDC